MKFRHEIKHVISLKDYFVLSQRLSAVMPRDIRGENESYQIRSFSEDMSAEEMQQFSWLF